MNDNLGVDRLPSGHELLGNRYRTSVASIFRGRRPLDGRTFWIKAPNRDYPTDATLRHLEAELRASDVLPFGPRATVRIDDDKTCWLLYEAHSGEPLTIGAAWDIGTFLGVARRLAESLEAIHARGLFFGLLEPSCVLWHANEASVGLLGAVRYADRELVRRLATSPYVAPELNGPDDVDITLAADIYSLGCIFYGLLTGEPPLPAATSESELDRRMQRIAPISAAGMPAALAELVMGMLAPSPASRPSSAGLVREALADIEDGGSAIDHATLFSVRRSVGRRDELHALTAAIDRGHSGDGAWILVSGEPGVGKSVLLRDAKKWTLAQNRIVAEGKFDQLRQGRPYGALLTAFRSAVELLLADADVQFERHRARFSAADRVLLGVLRAELPELEHVAGRLPAPARLGPSETEHRFKRAFRHVLECLCEPTLPLLLVLDDLQWADRATIELLKDWRQTSLPGSLVLVCCYREEEAARSPHVAAFLKLVDSSTHIQLRAFDVAQIVALCSEILPECDDLQKLGDLVHERSGGNPLHAHEVLKNLVANGELRRERGRWHLSLSRARLSHVSDTVVDLLVRRMGRFSASTRHVLMAAACIGQDFSAVLLAAALAEEPARTTEALRRAEAEGILIRLPPADDSYAFAHDRMQQAALSLSDDAFKTDVRLKLGRHYLRGAASSRQCLFGAVEYLNQVREQLAFEERQELAQLNWQAAINAKESIAYERAIPLARAFLEDAGDADQDARFAAALLLGECLFLNAEFAAAEQALTQARAVASTPERQVRVLRTSLLLSQHLQRYRDAIDSGLSALGVLGFALPARPGLARVLLGLALLMFRTRKVNPQTLAATADRTNERERAVLNILVTLWGPTFWVDQNLNALVVIHLMNLTLRLGNTPNAAMAYVCFAVLNHVIFKRYEVARQYGRVALAQLEVEGTAFVATRVRFLALTFFGAFERTPAQNVLAYEEALKDCIANGELVGSHLLDGIITTLPVHGFSLANVDARLGHYEKQARLLGAQSTLELIILARHWHRGLSEDGVSSLTALLSHQVEYKSYLGVRDLLAMELAYLWHDDEQVLRLAARARKDMVVQANPLHCAMYCLFSLLARCRKARAVGSVERRALRALTRFARIYPANFRSFQLLAEAEVLATRGKGLAARERYRQALDEAAVQGHELIGAIAAERLAASYDSGADRLLRDECLRSAAFAYARFGARAKSAQLRRRYPELTSWSAGPDEPAAQNVDLRIDAVMRAASTIAEETASAQLAPTLTRVVATAASAERAFLIQNVADQWTVLTGWQSNLGEIVREPVGLEACEVLARGVVRYVCRTKAVVALGNDTDERFADEPYLSRACPRSVLCVPLAHRGEVDAVIYLENSLYSEAFTPEQLRLVTLLGTQAAIALANADNQRLQVEAVQSRVNPHFLYNALSVVAELIATSPDRAEAVVLKLSRLYRSMLNSSVDRMVTLDQELALVRDYLELEGARFGDKFVVEWQIDGDLHTTRIPSLLLQPLVENAVHHGMRRKLERGVISISALRDGACLVLGVSDDGPGWYRSTGGNGFGLRSVEKRLKLLYGGSATLTIIRGQGVTVQVQLPLS